MKIVFIHLLNDYSGSPKVLSQVIKALEKRQKDIELYTAKGDIGFLSNLVPKHHTYFYKRFENKYLTLLLFMLSQAILLCKLFKYRKEDVSFYVNTMLPYGAALAGKLMGKPVIYHVHETYIKPAGFKRFLRFVIQKSASKIIFVSASLKRLEAFKNVPQTIIYNALSSDFLMEGNRYNYGFGANDIFNVLMVCSLKKYKGLDEFSSIAKLCLKEKDIVFTLVLNVSQKEIDIYFNGVPTPSNLRVYPKQKNVGIFYQKSSLLLNLSSIDQCVETFGLTILEAMAFGVPTIVPPVGGPAEIVSDNVEGYQISSYEIKKVANKIIWLSQNPEKCMELSKAAKMRAEDFREDVFEKEIVKAIYE